jgi:hypothetical protein
MPPKATRTKRATGHGGLRDWVVAIPTYKRPDGVTNKTLATLKDYGIEARRIFLFVATKEEEAEYLQMVPSKLYNKIIVAAPGLPNARNFISNYFPKGKHILMMDDDVTGFVELAADGSGVKLKSLKKLISLGFAEAEKAGARLWGIYPSTNPFFMKKKISTDLKFIVGCFWGTINPGKEVQVHFHEKEDYHRTLQHWKLDCAIVRVNWVFPKTKLYTNPGGAAGQRTGESEKKAVEFLMSNYPDLVRLNPRRKSGFTEILLARQSQEKCKDENK